MNPYSYVAARKRGASVMTEAARRASGLYRIGRIEWVGRGREGSVRLDDMEGWLRGIARDC